MEPSDSTSMRESACEDSMEIVPAPPSCPNISPFQATELQKHLADTESTRFGLDRHLSMICRHMNGDTPCGMDTRSDKSEHMTFDQALEVHLQETEDSTYAAAEGANNSSMVVDEALEAKYNSLKSRYRRMEDNYRREVDNLHEEIAVLQARMKVLDAARAQAQSNEALLAETLQKTTSEVSSELVELCCENHALSCENHELCRDLIAAKLSLAQCAEREIIWRHEMYKIRQTNKTLATKFAKLENLVLEIVDKK